MAPRRPRDSGRRYSSNRFTREPLDVFRQKEAERTVALVDSAISDKGFQPVTPVAPPPETPQSKKKKSFLSKMKQGLGGIGDIATGDFKEGLGDLGQAGGALLEAVDVPVKMVTGALSEPYGRLEIGPDGRPRRQFSGGSFLRGLKEQAQEAATLGLSDATDRRLRREKEIYGRAGIDPYGANALKVENLTRGGNEFNESNLPAGVKVAANIGLDPTNWVGVGALSRGAKALGVADKLANAPRGAKIAGSIATNLIEQPAAATLGAAAGGGLAAQFGEDVPGFNKLPGPLQVISGAMAGGMAPGMAPGLLRAGRRAIADPGTMLAGDVPMVSIAGSPTLPDTIAAGQRERFRNIETADVNVLSPSAPERGGLGPVAPPRTAFESRLDSILDTYRDANGRLQMTPEDLENAYIQASGAKKRQAANVRLPWMSINDMRKAIDLGVEGINWYRTFAVWLDEITQNRLGEALFNFAITSQQSPPDVNMIKAFNAMRVVNEITQGGTRQLMDSDIPRMIAELGAGTPMGITEEQIRKIAQGYIEGAAATTSPGAAKTPSYNQNLIDAFLGRFSAFTTADTHHLKPFGIQGAKFENAARAANAMQYAFVDRITAQLAREYGVEPSMIQAAMWQTIKKVTEDSAVRKLLNKRQISIGDAMERTRYNKATGGFEQSLASEAPVQAAYERLIESFKRYPPGPAKDFLYAFEPKKQTGDIRGFRVNSQIGDRLRADVQRRSPVVNVSTKPGALGPEALLADLLPEQAAFLQNVGYLPDRRQFAPLLEAGITHEVILEPGFGTWNGAEPNLRVRLDGGNVEKANYVAAWLAKNLDASQRGQDAVAISLPDSKVNTFRGLKIPARQGVWTPDEFQRIADAAAKYDLYPSQSNDGRFVEFNDYRLPEDTPDIYDARADTFFNSVENAVEDAGYSKAWMEANAGDSYLIFAGEFDDWLRRGGPVYDSQGVLVGQMASRSAADVGADAGGAAPSILARIKERAAGALASEAPAAGVTRRIEPDEDLFHGTPQRWRNRMEIKDSQVGELGPGFYTTTEAGRGPRGKKLATEYAKAEGFGHGRHAPSPEVYTFRANRPLDLLDSSGPILPDELARIRGALSPEALDTFEAALEEAHQYWPPLPDGENPRAVLVALGRADNVPDAMTRAGFSGISADTPRQTQQAFYNANDDLTMTGREKFYDKSPEVMALEDEIAALTAESSQLYMRRYESPEIADRWYEMVQKIRGVRDRLNQAIAEQSPAAGVSPRRARNAGGWVDNTGQRLDPVSMSLDEIAKTLDLDDETTAAIRENDRLWRAGEPAAKRLHDVLSKELWDLYIEEYGFPPRRFYRPGTRATNYEGIDEFSAARGLDPTEEANVLGEYLKPGQKGALPGELVMGAPHEIQGYQLPRQTPSEGLRDMAGRIGRGEQLPPEQARYGADQSGGALDVITKSYAGKTAAQIATRGAAGYAGGLLQGEDQETALERALLSMAPGSVARLGIKAGRIAEDIDALGVKKGGLGKGLDELAEERAGQKSELEGYLGGLAKADKRLAANAKRRAEAAAKREAAKAAGEEAAAKTAKKATRKQRVRDLLGLSGEGQTDTGSTGRLLRQMEDELGIRERTPGKIEGAANEAPTAAMPGFGADEPLVDASPVRDVPGGKPAEAIPAGSVEERRADPLRILSGNRAVEQRNALDKYRFGDSSVTPTYGPSPTENVQGSMLNEPVRFGDRPAPGEAVATVPAEPLGKDAGPVRDVPGGRPSGPLEARPPIERRYDPVRIISEQRDIQERGRRSLLEYGEKQPPVTPEDRAALDAAVRLQEERPPQEAQLAFEEFSKQVEKGRGKDTNWAVDVVKKMMLEWPLATSRAMFSLATHADFGAGLIQGSLFAWTHPKQWLRANLDSIVAFKSEAARNAQRQNWKAMLEDAVPDEWKATIWDRVNNGERTRLALSKSPEELARIKADKSGTRSLSTAERSSDFGSDILESERLGKASSWFRGWRRQYEASTEGMRVETLINIVKAQVAAAPDGVITGAQLDRAINIANHMTGATLHNLPPAAGIAFGAPRFLFSQIALLGDALSKGGVEGRFARREMFRAMGAMVGATVLANLVASRGQDWFGPGLGGPDDIKSPEDLRRVLTHPNFGRVRVNVPGLGQSDLSVFGPLHPILQTFTKELVTAASLDMPGAATGNFLEGRASPLVRAGLTIARGADKYSGEEVNDPIDFLMLQGRNSMPITFQNILDVYEGKGSWTNTMAEFGGVRASPTTIAERAQQVLSTLPSEYWVVDNKTQQFRPPESIWELSKKERESLRENYPAVDAYLRRAEEDPNAPFIQKVAREFEATQPVWDEKLLNGEMTQDEYRRQFIANQRQMKAIRERNSNGEDYKIRTQRDADIRDYFAIFDEDPNAPADFDRVDEGMLALKARIGQSRWDDVTESLGWNKSELVQTYLKDMQLYGEFLSTNPKYVGIEASQTRKADRIAARVRQVQAQNPGTPSRFIVADMRQKGVIDDEEMRLALIAIAGRTTPQYDEWKAGEGARAVAWFKQGFYDQRDVIEGAPKVGRSRRSRGSASSRARSRRERSA